MRQRTKRRQQQILAATLDENYITIYHPGKYSGGVDWDDAAGMLISRLKQKPILNNMHSL
mgnify:CR=1 FL=1